MHLTMEVELGTVFTWTGITGALPRLPGRICVGKRKWSSLFEFCGLVQVTLEGCSTGGVREFSR